VLRGSPHTSHIPAGVNGVWDLVFGAGAVLLLAVLEGVLRKVVAELATGGGATGGKLGSSKWPSSLCKDSPSESSKYFFS
jgi:hypothetical protein